MKKGQAALEFMTTYGWAILTVLIGVGALMSLGLFDNTQVLSERCIAGTPFSCADNLFVLSAEGFLVEIRKTELRDINISNLQYRHAESPDFIDCENFDSLIIDRRNRRYLKCEFSESDSDLLSPVIGQYDQIDFRITYSFTDGLSTRQRNSVGEMGSAILASINFSDYQDPWSDDIPVPMTFSQVKNNGLVGYYQFDELQSNIIADSSPLARTGTIFGGVNGELVGVAQWTHNGVYFDGSDEGAIEFASGHYDFDVDNDFTLFADYTHIGHIDQSSSTPTANIIGKGVLTSSYGLIVRNESLRFAVRRSDDFSNNTGTAFDFLDEGERYRVVGIHDSDDQTIELYVNSVSFGQRDVSDVDTFSNTYNFKIGSRNVIGGNVRDLNGTIHRAAVFNRTLSAGEVSSLSAGNRLTDGLIGEWLLQEGSGPNVYDTSMYQESISGTGIMYDGQNIYSRINAHPAHDINSTITLSAWVKPLDDDSSKQHYIIDRRDYTEAGYYLMYQTQGSSNVFSFRFFDGTISSTTSPSLGNWYHVAATYDGSNLRMYVNGVLENSQSFSPSITEVISPVFIGQRYTNNNRFNGVIDEVMIFNRSLAEEEISLVYTQLS